MGWWITGQVLITTHHGRTSQDHGHCGMLLLPKAWEGFGLRKCRVRAAGTFPGSVHAPSTLSWVQLQLIRDLYQPKLMCFCNSRCVLPLEWLCAKQWWQEWQSQPPQGYFIFLLFPPSGTVALNSKVLFAKLAGENALMLDQQGDTTEQAGWGEWATIHQGNISS